jgi:short-subunit dehydrogenase
MATPFRRALVTGASSGIGRALVLELAGRGTAVVALARRRERLDELAREVRMRHPAAPPVAVLELDVTDGDALAVAIARADDEAPFDLVVANAGVGLGAPAAELTRAAVERTFAVNVLAAAATLQAALPGMLARRRGTLCGVSSLAGSGGMPGSGAYAASKAALSTLLETFAIDLAGSGVRVCDVQPGYVHSEMTAGASHPLPLVWSAERAAAHIVARLERGAVRVRFPWPIVLGLDALRVLPRWVWRAVMRRLSRAR